MTPPQPQDTPTRRGVWQIPLIFILLSGVWILLSDRILLLFVAEPAEIAWLQTVKGWLYVLAMGLVLLILMRRNQQEVLAAHRKLADTERQWRTLLQSSPDAILVHRQGKIVFANRAAELMLGAAPAARLEGRDLSEFLRPDCRQAVVAAPASPVPEHEICIRQESVLTLAGAAIRVELRGTPVDFAGDRAYQLVMRDVTARSKAEQQIREREMRFRSIFNNAAVGVALVDHTGHFIDANEAECRFLGYTHEELVGMHFRDITHPDDRASSLSRVEELAHGEQQNFLLDKRYLRKDGEVVWGRLWVSSLESPPGQPPHMVVVCEDITRHKQVEQALQRELEIKSVLAGMLEPILRPAITLPEISQLLFEKAKQLTGSQHGFTGIIDPVTGEHLSFNISPLLGSEGHPEPERGLSTFPPLSEGYPGLCGHALNTGRPFFTNQPEQHPAYQGIPKGHVAVRRFMAVPVILGAEVVGQIAVANAEHDYTEEDLATLGQLTSFFALAIEKIRYQENIQAARHRAEAASRSKTEFLANMSHEIRTPLNGVLGMLQLLQTTDLDEEQQGYAEMALKSGNNLLHLLSEILDLSRIEAGGLKLRSESFPISELLESSLALFRQPATEKSLALEQNVAEDVPGYIIGDMQRLRQILFNLVGNAVKFTGKGSIRVDVDASEADAKGIVDLQICVADTGIGIAPEIRKTIFDPFIQEDGTYQRRYQGAGLGLAIVRRLVELMNGEIDMQSEVGRGTSVCFKVPVKVDPTDHAGGDANSDTTCAAAKHAPANILIAEDNSGNRRMLTLVLEKWGHRVTGAEDGRATLEALASKGSFDLILLDMQMPDMDGMEVTRRIREDSSGAFDPQIPVIALTAHAMSGDRERLLEAGATEYLAKPFDLNALKDLIARYARESVAAL